MNDGYLLAGCVIDYLVKIRFICRREWMHNTKELCGNEPFFWQGRGHQRSFLK